MIINKKETKVMKYCRNGKQKAEIFVDGGNLVLVDTFKYLGGA